MCLIERHHLLSIMGERVYSGRRLTEFGPEEKSS